MVKKVINLVAEEVILTFASGPERVPLPASRIVVVEEGTGKIPIELLPDGIGGSNYSESEYGS